MKRITWVLFLSFSALSIGAQPLTLEALHAKLHKAGASWVAGDTKVSTLSAEDQKRLLGANLVDHSDFFFAPKEPALYGPSSWDWRSVKGTKYSSPILDQGRCGSCVAFASIGQLETQLNITRKTTDSPWAFSPQHLFSCGGGGCNKGWMPFSALGFLQSNGVPDEACFPYQSGALGEDIACSNTCGDSNRRSLKIVRYATESFFFVSRNALKKALQKGPLLATMQVYEDLMYYKSGIYSHTSGKQLGGHAVVIEGWDDATSSWLVRNSWGEDWGEGGYFRIGWSDDSGVGNNSWSIEVPDSSDGMVSLGSLRDHAVLSSNAQAIQLESTFADTKKVSWQLLRGTKTVAEGSSSRGSTVTIDTTPHADGAYQLAAVAERAKREERSQPREVYILNGVLSGSLRINNVKARDVLTGKKILECDIQSSPIPFSQISFNAKNLATGEVISRRTTNIAKKINLSFYTPRIANGDWELNLVGVAGTQSIESPKVKVTVKN